MKKSLTFSLILIALASLVRAQQTNTASALSSLVEAERAFARTSVARGTRAAFLENLADDSVLFHPRPVNGKSWWTAQTPRPGVLTWQPIFADVSRASDLGYTTGPWEFRAKSLDDKPVAFGNYVTIWKRQTDGVWKVALDLGTSNKQPPTLAPELRLPRDYPTDRNAKSEIDVEEARSQLLKAESDFLKLLTAKKTVDTYLSYLADGARLFRMNEFPVVGKEGMRAALTAQAVMLTWQATKAEVSLSGDLGYTYGTYQLKATGDGQPTENGNYMRIWKKQNGKWRVVLDLLNPIPPSQS
jgi:ketosteroid isomerase-like protein